MVSNKREIIRSLVNTYTVNVVRKKLFNFRFVIKKGKEIRITLYVPSDKSRVTSFRKRDYDM